MGFLLSRFAPSTSSVSFSGKYHSTALPGSLVNPSSSRESGVSSPACQGRGSPVAASCPACTWISDSAAGEVDASNA